MKSLQDRVICITGATSGIGRATAIQCARAGMHVVVAARRLDRLEELVNELEKTGRQALAVQCDIGNDANTGDPVQRCIERFGRVDVVLANAGYGHEGSIMDLSDQALRQIFEVNFFGTVRVARAAVAAFRNQGRGHLLITSSCLSRFTLPYFSAYSATKAAQTHMARALRLELEHEGIEVSVIHPITTRTDFFDTASDIAGERRRGIPKHTPRFFVQTPERVAKAIVKCLRKPTPEVWTSHITRLVAGAMVAFPAFHDFCCRRELKHRNIGNEPGEVAPRMGAPGENTAF